MSQHRYGFVTNNPVNMIDPDGYWGEWATSAQVQQLISDPVGSTVQAIEKGTEIVVNAQLDAIEQVANFDTSFSVFNTSVNIRNQFNGSYHDGTLILQDDLMGAATTPNHNYTANAQGDLVVGNETYLLGGSVSVGVDGQVVYHNGGVISNQAGRNALGVSTNQEYLNRNKADAIAQMNYSLMQAKNERDQRLRQIEGEQFNAMAKGWIEEANMENELTVLEALREIYNMPVEPLPGWVDTIGQGIYWTGDLLTFGQFSKAIENAQDAGDTLYEEGLTAHSVGKLTFSTLGGTARIAAPALLEGYLLGKLNSFATGFMNGSSGLISSAQASQIATVAGGTVVQLRNGYKIIINNPGGQNIIIRLMNAGSGGRTLPYFRISIPNKGSLNNLGIISSDPALTHFNLNPATFVDDIVNILSKFNS